MLYTGVSFPPEKARGSGYNERVSRGLPLIGCRHRSARPSSAALSNLHQQTRPRDWLASESLRKHIYLCVYVDNLDVHYCDYLWELVEQQLLRDSSFNIT